MAQHLQVIPAGGVLAVLVLPVRIDEVGVGAAQLLQHLVHLGHAALQGGPAAETAVTAAGGHTARHIRDDVGRVAAGGDQHGVQQLLKGITLALGDRRAAGVGLDVVDLAGDADLEISVHVLYRGAGVQHLGDAADLHLLVRVLFIQDHVVGLVVQNGSGDTGGRLVADPLQLLFGNGKGGQRKGRQQRRHRQQGQRSSEITLHFITLINRFGIV